MWKLHVELIIDGLIRHSGIKERFRHLTNAVNDIENRMHFRGDISLSDKSRKTMVVCLEHEVWLM